MLKLLAKRALRFFLRTDAPLLPVLASSLPPLALASAADASTASSTLLLASVAFLATRSSARFRRPRVALRQQRQQREPSTKDQQAPTTPRFVSRLAADGHCLAQVIETPEAAADTELNVSQFPLQRAAV